VQIVIDPYRTLVWVGPGHAPFSALLFPAVSATSFSCRQDSHPADCRSKVFFSRIDTVTKNETHGQLSRFRNSENVKMSTVRLPEPVKFRAQPLTRFLQLGQTSLRLIRVRRVGMFFYDLPIKFRSVRLVEASLRAARYRINLFQARKRFGLRVSNHVSLRRVGTATFLYLPSGPVMIVQFFPGDEPIGRNYIREERFHVFAIPKV
jgi:hypothetical protein